MLSLARMKSPLPKGDLPGRRSRLLVVASTAYVAAASLRAAEGHGAKTWGLALVAVGIALLAAGRERRTRLTWWGLAIVIASLGAPTLGGWIGAFGMIGAAVAVIAARVAIARVTAPPGLASLPPASPIPAIVLIGATWALAIFASCAEAWGAPWSIARNAREWAWLASFVSGAVLIGETLRASQARRLELGVAARMRAASALATAVAVVSWGIWFIDLAEGEASARASLVVASILVSVVSLKGDPVQIARISRRVLALAIVGGPVVMVATTTVQGRPWDAAAIMAVSGVLALAIGAASPVLEEPLRPARGAWLDAVERAHEALLRTDPDEAVREALVALRAPAGPSAASPELWIFDPIRVSTVDAAGYAHEREGVLPETLVKTTAAEPEAMLRMEVLDSLLVRRPDLRPLARWLDDRTAMLATVITRAGEAEGLLVLPRGQRGEPLSLEEARAIKRFADALAAICHARAALTRSLAREREAVLRAEAADDKLARVEHEMQVHVGRHALAAARLARPATVGVYSASSRMAYDALERRIRASNTVAAIAPSGVDPIPYIARAHLGGPRSAGPLVLVDATSSREHDLERWSDPSASPLALADRGLLVLLDGAALPLDVQRLIARALAERRPPWERAEPLDVALAITAVTPLSDLAASGRIDPALAARLGDALDSPILLPRLRDRPEDIRAILTDRLAREGLRVKGTPVGIDDAAFSRLVEHLFTGEDAELASIVQRLVASCTGEVIRASDVALLPLDEPAPASGQARRG